MQKIINEKIKIYIYNHNHIYIKTSEKNTKKH